LRSINLLIESKIVHVGAEKVYVESEDFSFTFNDAMSVHIKNRRKFNAHVNNISHHRIFLVSIKTAFPFPVSRGSAAFSEPETAAVRDFILARKRNLQMYLTFHRYNHKVLTYIEYRAVSDVFRTINPPPPLYQRECPPPAPKDTLAGR
jgi:hypothetical protein